MRAATGNTTQSRGTSNNAIAGFFQERSVGFYLDIVNETVLALRRHAH